MARWVLQHRSERVAGFSVPDIVEAEDHRVLVEGLANILIEPFRIENLLLSVRALNALKRGEMRTLWDLLRKPDRELRNLKNCGSITRKEIIQRANDVWGVRLPNWERTIDDHENYRRRKGQQKKTLQAKSEPSINGETAAQAEYYGPGNRQELSRTDENAADSV